MNHEVRYSNFIQRCRNRVLPKGTKVERHHILPRSLGGTDETSNLIALTLREHYLAHLILWKCYGDKMAHAFWYMSHNPRYPKRLSSREYASLREAKSRALSASLLGKPSRNKGTVLSEESKQRISEHNARYWRGRHHSEDTKNKIREKRASQDMSYRHSAYTLLSPDGKEVAFQSVKEILLTLGVQDGGYFYRLVSGNIAELNGWKFVRKGAKNADDQVTARNGFVQIYDDAVSSPQVP